MLAGMAVARVAAAQAPRQPTKPRTRPQICLLSRQLAKLEYQDLGPILQQLGFDGCNLTVEPNGHVRPDLASVDLSRAIETMRGSTVDVPVITTAFTTLADPTIRNVMAIAGLMGVHYFRPGYWQYSESADVTTRLVSVERDMAGLSALGRATGLAMGVHNRAGDVGEAIWDTYTVIDGLDPQWTGYDFDPGAATAASGSSGWYVAMRLALPRIKMVTLSDFTWSKDGGGAWQAAPCPLGEGMVDWTKFFSTLARAKFTGPITLQMDYKPQDPLKAISRELEWTRKQVGTAYQNVS